MIIRIFILIVGVLGSYSSLEAQENKLGVLLLDMQPYFYLRAGNFQLGSNEELAKKAKEEQVKALEWAMNNKLPIVIIEYEFLAADGTVIEHPLFETHPQLKDAVGAYPNLKVLKKNTDSAFSSDNKTVGELNSHLEALGIKDLLVLGANGGDCVQLTIQDALKEFNVYQYQKGTIDFNRVHFAYPYENKVRNEATCFFKSIENLGYLNGHLGITTPTLPLEVFNQPRLLEAIQAIQKKGAVGAAGSVSEGQ